MPPSADDGGGLGGIGGIGKSGVLPGGVLVLPLGVAAVCGVVMFGLLAALSELMLPKALLPPELPPGLPLFAADGGDVTELSGVTSN